MWCTCPVTIRRLSTVLLSIHIRLLPIHPPAIMRQAWPFLSVSGWRWGQLGAADGAVTADGAATTISPSITITRTSTTQTGKAKTMFQIGAVIEPGATAGSTIPSIVEVLLTRTKQLRTDTEAPPAVIR